MRAVRDETFRPPRSSDNHWAMLAEIITRGGYRNTTALQSLDLERHNRQYPPVTVTECDRYHDRFLIIDDTVYHLGALLKDLGNRLFAFGRMEMDAVKILQAYDQTCCQEEGVNSGKEFWSCSGYPNCNGTRSLKV